MKSDPNDRGTAAKDRYVIVVARTERQLYDYLREVLAHDEKVEVILDRRREEQRPLDVQERLRHLGWATARRREPTPHS